MIDFACKYAELGFKVLPVLSYRKNKNPLLKNGAKGASGDIATIKDWWSKRPKAGIGILVGPEGGLSVLDVDPRNGGEESFRRLCLEFSDMPTTVQCVSGGGGSHYYFNYAQGFSLPPGEWPGLDIKSSKNMYVVAPPSVHISGNSYDWVSDQALGEINIADAPPFLINKNSKKLSPLREGARGLENIDIDEQKSDMSHFYKGADSGARHTTLCKLVGSWLNDGLNYEECRENAGLWNCRNKEKLKDDEINHIIKGLAEKHFTDHPEDAAFARMRDERKEGGGDGGGKEEKPVSGDFRAGELSNRNKDFKLACLVVEIYRNKTETLAYCLTSQDFFQYKDGVYHILTEKEIDFLIMAALPDKSLSIRKIYEIKSFIKIISARKTTKDEHPNILNLQNGLYDISKHQLIPHTPKVFTTVQLAVAFDTDKNCPLWTQTLNEIFDSDLNKIRTLQEFFGYCLTRDTRFHKSLYLIGKGSNGKSVILHILQELLGRENYSSLPLTSFDNPTLISSLENKFANITSEIKAKSSVCDSIFKQIVSGDPVEINPKYKNPYHKSLFCKLIFASNSTPRVDDHSDGYFRRLLFIPFTRSFEEGDGETDADLRFKIAEKELDGVFNWAISGLKTLRKRGRFLIDGYMKQVIDDYRRENNPVLVFGEMMCEFGPMMEVKFSEIYEKYTGWMKENGHTRPLSKIKFSKEFLESFEKKGVWKTRKGHENKWYFEGVEMTKVWNLE